MGVWCCVLVDLVCRGGGLSHFVAVFFHRAVKGFHLFVDGGVVQCSLV